MAESFEEQLCDQVRSYTHLYDVSSPLHSDKYACQNSWREISTVLKVDVETCKLKWKQIRDRYVRARRKMKEKRSGDGAEGVFCPAVIRRLSWLCNFINHRATETNFPQSDKVPSEEPIVNPTPSPTSEPGTSPSPSVQTSDIYSEPFTSPTKPTVQRKKKSVEEVDAALLQRLAEIREETRASQNIYSSFGNYIAMFLKELPPDASKRLMKEIKQLMQCYE